MKVAEDLLRDYAKSFDAGSRKPVAGHISSIVVVPAMETVKTFTDSMFHSQALLDAIRWDFEFFDPVSDMIKANDTLDISALRAHDFTFTCVNLYTPQNTDKVAFRFDVSCEPTANTLQTTPDTD